jgi:hypothetical protein
MPGNPTYSIVAGEFGTSHTLQWSPLFSPFMRLFGDAFQTFVVIVVVHVELRL